VKEILLDANVLVSFLTDRNEEQRRKASALFRGAAEREHTLVLHTISIVEMVYVLTQLYEQEPSQVAEAVADLLAMPGVLAEDEVSWPLVLERWPETLRSLGDAIVAAVASQGQYDAVATFDTTLRKKLVRQGSVPYWRD
jgi:predicted nucleic acid-binding protein